MQIAVRNLLIYFRNYYRMSSDHKTTPARLRIIVKVMTTLYDCHFRFVHNRVVGDNPFETIKGMDIRVSGRGSMAPPPGADWRMCRS